MLFIFSKPKCPYPRQTRHNCNKEEQKMKKPSTNAIQLIVGLFLFLLGLLMLLNQATVVGAFSQILPNAEAIEIVGVTLQLLGGFLIIHGTIRSVSNEFMAQQRKERQAQLTILNQTMERIDQRTIENTNKLASLIMSTQETRRNQFSPQGTSRCKYCDAAIDPSASFCPNCGRSQR
jgi:hypothetical protein